MQIPEINKISTDIKDLTIYLRSIKKVWEINII